MNRSVNTTSALAAFTFAVLAALAAGSARADVTCTVSGPGAGGATVQKCALNTMTGKWEIELVATDDTAWVQFEIVADDFDAIDYIRVWAENDNQQVRLVVRGDPDPEYLASVDEISTWAEDGVVVLDLLRTGGDVGVIDVHWISDAEIGGDLTGWVTARLNFVTINGIGLLRVSGDLLGPVDAAGGIIGSIRVEGDVGTSTASVSIEMDELEEVLVGGKAFMDIRACAKCFPPLLVKRVRVEGGDFVGTIFTETLGSGATGDGIFVAGDVDTGFSEWNIGTFMNADIEILGSFDGIIRLPSQGLERQVVINGADDGGTWDGDIIVATTTLDPVPFYEQTGLGGGAVGLVPFGLHRWESVPAYDGANWPTTSQSHPTIKLVHYGPVAWGSGAKPFEVFESVGDHCTTEFCFHGDFIDVTDDWNLVGGTGRELIVEPDSGATGVREGWHYHIRPVRSGSDTLFCNQIQAQNVPVANYGDYIIYRPD
jgi:hypothetical protein